MTVAGSGGMMTEGEYIEVSAQAMMACGGDSDYDEDYVYVGPYVSYYGPTATATVELNTCTGEEITLNGWHRVYLHFWYMDGGGHYEDYDAYAGTWVSEMGS